MSEGYEIGMTLALRDGVGESIERARRDMIEFQKILSNGGVAVSKLRDAVVVTAAPERKNEIEVSRKLAHTISLPLTEQSLSTPAVTSIPGDARIEPLRSTDAAPMYAPAATIQPFQSQDPRLIKPAPAKTIPEIELINNLNTERAVGQLPPSPTTPAIPLPGRVDLAGSEVIYSRQRSLQSVQPEGVVGDADAYRAPIRSAPQTLQTESRTKQPNVTVATTAPGGANAPEPSNQVERQTFYDNAAPQSEAGSKHATAPQRYAPPSQSPAAPNSSLAGPPAENVGRPSTSALSAPASPQNTAPTQTPVEGDVFLDGILVGRWISKFLQRGAERAPSGPTGFDGRRNRLLPGATVGG